MRRKRRKAYKKWKILNATVCGPQSAHQACQNNIKDLEKEVKEDTSEAVFHQTEALGKSKKNGDKRASASVNGKQDSPLLPKDKKQPPSYSKISREKESDDSASSISHQLEKVLPVVMFNDCEESLSGKVTLKDFPNTVEAFKSAKGKIITEVKRGVFNVQVEIKNRFFCETGMQFPTKKRCPKCHQHYSVRHIQRTYTSRSGSSTSKNILIEELKLEAPSKSEGEITRTESPSLKVSIVGKGIKVKYMSKRQNILINITYPKIRRKIAKHRNISTSHSTKACSKSSAHSDMRPPEKWQFENKHQSSDCWHAVKKNFDTVVVSLCSTPEREKNKPHTLSSALDNNKVESAISQRKFKISQNTPEKKHFCETEILLRNVLISHDTLKTTSLSDTYVSKIPFEDAKDVDRERKIIFDTVENITSESDIRRSPEGINYLPSTITDIFPVQDGKGSDFCPSSSLSMQLVEEKAANTYCKGSKITPADGCENSHSLSFPSSQNAPKSSTPFSPSHWATAHSEPKETPGDTLFFNQCAEFLKDYEEEHVDMTDRDFNKVIPHGDSRMKAQQLLATKSAQWVPLSPVPSSSLAASSPLSSSNRSTVERGQTKSRESHPETAASSRTKAPVTTSITDELEQRLIIQNEKEGSVYSNHPIVMKNPKESPSSLGYIENDKFQMMSMVKNACHREFEDLPNENRDEFCFQTDFPNTGEFSCSMCATDNVFLIDKTLTNDADQYGKQDATNLGLTSFKQEPTECQRIASTKPNDGGDKTDPEAAHDHQVDILLSPQKQTALKDWNLEINSLHKLSEELAPRGTRVSDGSQEEATDQWARRRQQFKDGKRCSSAGGSSFASSITEGSVYPSYRHSEVTSEDGCSVDLGFRVNLEGRGFYTENFHSAAWIFQGDDGNPEYSPRCLSKKPRPVAVRERTVRLIKGTGDYPWGFRIQFSKPIVVTEVDANSAAEEAGLQIGDRVLAINGTEVTSAEHADAVHLARKGPDILTLVVGSDISRCPSSPWPTCRGYLHKRTHSGFVKGWRKRWFVLKHDSCLYYYRHKKIKFWTLPESSQCDIAAQQKPTTFKANAKSPLIHFLDEGKCPPLEVIKLEGAEVGIDSSLGKPFVFNCVPQSGNRAFCLCATSNQEMKRWLEAMGKATHPVRQNHVWEYVTLHNSSLPPLAIKSPECLGLLHRLDCSTDMWVQHYCILKDGCLYFYASIRSTQASGGLYLQGYRVNELTLSIKQSIIELKPPSEGLRTFYFCAENKTENQRWIGALKMSIKQWLPLHQAIQELMGRPLEETRM